MKRRKRCVRIWELDRDTVPTSLWVKCWTRTERFSSQCRQNFIFLLFLSFSLCIYEFFLKFCFFTWIAATSSLLDFLVLTENFLISFCSFFHTLNIWKWLARRESELCTLRGAKYALESNHCLSARRMCDFTSFLFLNRCCGVLLRYFLPFLDLFRWWCLAKLRSCATLI